MDNTKKIKSPTLQAVQDEVDEFFKGKNYTKKSYDIFTKALLSAKIIDMEAEIEGWKRSSVNSQIRS